MEPPNHKFRTDFGIIPSTTRSTFCATKAKFQFWLSYHIKPTRLKIVQKRDVLYLHIIL